MLFTLSHRATRRLISSGGSLVEPPQRVGLCYQIHLYSQSGFILVHLLLLKIVQKMMQLGYGQATNTMIHGGILLVVYYREVVREERREGFAQYAGMILID
jgi:hypothetical protein